MRVTVKRAQRSRAVRKATKPTVVLTPTGAKAAKSVRVTVRRAPK